MTRVGVLAFCVRRGVDGGRSCGTDAVGSWSCWNAGARLGDYVRGCAMTNPAANWYPDPQDPTQLRYWDGTQWTEHRAPRQPPAEPAPPQATAPVPSEPVASAPAVSKSKVPLFGARGVARQQADELDHLRGEMQRLGVLDAVELRQEADDLRNQIEGMRRDYAKQKALLDSELADLRQRVAVTQEEEILQEVGIYTYRHPLSESVAYREQLKILQDQVKAMARKDGGAIQATTNWQVNGSAAQGRKMVNDFSKLMLRAYNAEADNLSRGMKPYKLATAIDRLEKVAVTIERLGRTMAIRVSPDYHRLRIKELELAADYQEMLAREKDAEREKREQLREERKLQQEIQRERERLQKEQQHYANALAALEANADHEGAARMREQLGDIAKAIEDVDYRAANVRAGYVYVISNVGAFGERMIKVGMTRRLEPMDRIKELSDASVPFNFDVHALFFSNDAVDIEHKMHAHLAEQRVNRVNLRREFFYATPGEARDLLRELTGELLQFEELPEAVEYHQSQATSKPRAVDPEISH